MIAQLSFFLFCNSGECQSKVRLLGGLRALITVLKEYVRDKQPSDEILYFVEHVVNTIGSSTAGHGRSLCCIMYHHINKTLR